MDDLFRAHLEDTPISDDEKRGLIPSLSTQRELNEFEQANILSAVKWATSPRRLAKAEILNVTYLLELHRRMFNATWRWAGKRRQSEKTIGVEHHRIMSDLAVLIGDADYWIAEKTFSPDEIALRFHHRLVLIHPFVNGNGRHARLMADIMARKFERPVFPWGVGTAEPSVIRQAYLAALSKADDQDYGALLHFARSITKPAVA